MAKNNNKDIVQIGMFAALVASIKSNPGTLITSATPMEKSETISAINTEAPVIMRMMPIHFPTNFKKKRMISPRASKNVFEPDSLF